VRSGNRWLILYAVIKAGTVLAVVLSGHHVLALIVLVALVTPNILFLWMRRRVAKRG
jgi:hypothetical protein